MGFLSHPKLEPTVAVVGVGYVIDLTLAQVEAGVRKGILFVGHDGTTWVSHDHSYNDVTDLSYEA